MTTSRRHAVCIVGAGPRGTSVLERLSVRATSPVDVHVVDPWPPGGGRIWGADQPAHLLMNTFAGDATLFLDETVETTSGPAPGPTLYEWATTSPLPPDATKEMRAEAAQLKPWSHPSRALQGRYLAWVFDAARNRSPWITVTVHRKRATACWDRPDGRQEVHLEGTDRPLVVDVVVLTTGHVPLEPTGSAHDLARRARVAGTYYGLPANPLDQDLTPIRAGDPLLCRGLGMNFFDYVSLLTVGRGGRFERAGDGLRYVPSGHEPRIWAGSGRGVPYRAKGIYRGDPPGYRPRHFTAATVDRLLARGGQADFRSDVWPLVVRDGALAYYGVLARHQPGVWAGPPAALARQLEELEWGTSELEAAIAAHVPDPRWRLDLAVLDRPAAGLRLPDRAALSAWTTEQLRQDLREARRGTASPMKVASHVIGAARGPLRRLARYGGIRGQSLRRDLAWFRGFAGSLASGPPAVRIVELLALHEAGVVDFIGPDMTVELDGVRYVAGSSAVPQVVRARALLEAHLPGTDLVSAADPLLRQLLESGQIRPHVVPDVHEGDWASGAIDITGSPYRVVRANGVPHPQRFALGIVVEGAHWGTQLGAIARSNSQFLRETDAVAEAALLACRAVAVV